MNNKKLRIIALFLSLLVLSLPISLASELNLVYDGNGNLVSGDGFVREYNGFNQLIQVKNDSGDILQEFVYHPVEERILIKKVYEEGVLDQKIFYVNENYVHIENASGNYSETYVYQNGQMVGQEINGVKQALHPDHLGSTSLVTDSSGNVVEDNFYSPFGEELGNVESRYGYEAKERDEITGETDFHFRMYKSEWGRFTQPDSLIPDLHSPQSLNRYSFEENNPLNYVDPSGHKSKGVSSKDIGTANTNSNLVNAIYIKLFEPIIVRRELNARLTSEYMESTSLNKCFGCEGFPKSRELQRRDLRKNLRIEFDKEGVGTYYYKENLIGNEKDVKRLGFYKGVVRDETDYQYNLFTAEEQDSEKGKSPKEKESSGGSCNLNCAAPTGEFLKPNCNVNEDANQCRY